MLLTKATVDMMGEAAYLASSGDKAEFHKMKSGRDMATVLMGSTDETSRAIVHNGKLLAVGGSKGCLWFITTKHVDNLTPPEKVELLGVLRGHLEECRETMEPEHLTNLVWTGNTAHIRLLKHLGARFNDHITTSPAGFPFIQFWL